MKSEAVLSAAAVSCATTAAIVLLRQAQAGYWRSGLHVMLETAASLTAVLAAFLAVGRFRRHTLMNELMLASALAVLAVSTLFLGTMVLLGVSAPSGLADQALLAGNMLGALLFVLGASVPHRRPGMGGLVLAGGVAAIAAALVGAAALAVRLHQRLATAPHIVLGPRAPPMPAPHLLMAVLYGLAVIGYLARFQQLGEEFLEWLAIAGLLATAAQVDDFLHPVPGPGSAYLSELFQLFFWAVIVIGLMREAQSYWRARSQAAVLEERRRVACDLHDGLTQELAYLARNLQLLNGQTSVETVERLQHSVERAQLESRLRIRELATVSGQALEVALRDAVDEIAKRFQVELEFDTMRDIHMPESRAEAIVRIACEAVTNAARHSGASLVRVSLKHDGQHVHLQVSDAGCGFDPEVGGAGFGLVSMRERAQSAGADMRISSIPGRGSEVEVVM